MSTAPAIVNATWATIDNAEAQFVKVANAFGQLNFSIEANFAKQIIVGTHTGNDNKDSKALIGCTQNSIFNAISQVAEIGLTLNPKVGHAYLLPRFNFQTGSLECTLEPSFKGLIHLAIEGGSITHCTADVVYKDDFENKRLIFKGANKEIEISDDLDPFKTQKDSDIYGAYCTAFLKEGGVITTVMRRSEIDLARSKAGPNSPAWRLWFPEMAKKSVIRRASKLWPAPKKDLRYHNAIDALQKYDNSDMYHEAANSPVHQTTSLKQVSPAISGENTKPRPLSLSEMTKRLAAQ